MDPGPAQCWRDAAPARVSALVGAAAPSAAGPYGDGDTQKKLCRSSPKPRSPSMRVNNRLNFGGRTKPGLVSRGTLTHVWAERGSRPPAPRDQRREWAYLFGAIHAVLLLDRAGWPQTGGKLRVPRNISLLHLPPFSPELNPAEGMQSSQNQNALAQLPHEIGRRSYRWYKTVDFLVHSAFGHRLDQ